jgi:hypothetical protein
MTHWTDDNPWIWVLVQDPEGNEQFLGQYDEEKGISFIPLFQDKEAAQEALPGLARDKSLKYQAQAIRYRHLASHAAENGFQLFLLDRSGRILETIAP